jgi:RNA polymerase sigma factor (sigma-70 family)
MQIDSFDAFYKKAWSFCKPRLRKLTTNDADIEDVFAEAIAKYWINRQEIDAKTDSNPEALVYVIARNNWLGMYRKNKNVFLESIQTSGLVDDDDAELQLPSGEADALDQWIQNDNAYQTDQAMASAWSKLDDKCQALLTATIVYKEKQELTMERLGIKNTNTVKASKYRCLQYLKKFYLQQV